MRLEAALRCSSRPFLRAVALGAALLVVPGLAVQFLQQGLVQEPRRGHPVPVAPHGKAPKELTLLSGTTANLTEDGFKAVAAMGLDAEMKSFVRRLASSVSRPIQPWMEADLSGMIPFYNGVKNLLKFRQLLHEVESAPWLSKTEQEAEAHQVVREEIPLAQRSLVVVRDLRPRPLLFCALSSNENLPWQRLLLRIGGSRNWNVNGDADVNYAVMYELDYVGVVEGKPYNPQAQKQIFHRKQGAPFVTAAIVRDPVTRLLASYLDICRDTGEWHRCRSSKGPVLFSQTIAALEQADLTKDVEVMFMRQVDQCELRNVNYDFIGHYEYYAQDSRVILEHTRLWKKYGLGWGTLGTADFGSTFRGDGADSKVCDFYTPDLLQRVFTLYKDDFDKFGYDVHFWNFQCASSWNMLVKRGAHFQRRMLPSKVGRLPLDGRSFCAPTATELLAVSGLRESSPVADNSSIKFFLHDRGPFNFTEVVHCFLQSKGLSFKLDDWDNKLYANIAEHLSELWLLRGIEKHPQRTFNRSEANLHIIGVPLFTSFLAAEQHVCGSPIDHLTRMQRVRDRLLTLKEFQRSDGRDFFILSTHFSIAKVFTEALLEILNRGNIIVGTADKDFLQWSNYPGVRRLVFLPYKTHHVVEADALAEADAAHAAAAPGAAAAAKSGGQRNISFIFHGEMTRRLEGQHRSVMKTLAGFIDNVELRDASFLALKPSDAAATAHAYLRSNFCFVPAGDTPTSRRLFDALAAGCIPVCLGNFDRLARNLPFRRTIDWSQIILFAGSLRCVESDAPQTGAWLNQLVGKRGRYDEVVERMRSQGRQVFREVLSYVRPNGMVTALLRELALELRMPSPHSGGNGSLPL